MCGIVGYILRENKSEELRISDAIASLHHRGPDENGIWKGKRACFGHTRLSIIDIEGGKQPMVSHDLRYVIIFNGEIYNFLELKRELEKAGYFFKTKSDTEVILNLFIQEGFENCLNKLRGMFAFAIWDNKENRLFIARDRLGVKPLFYAEVSDGFIFSSQINALFSLYHKLSREIDFVAIDHYFTFQYIPSPMTAFLSIRKLKPAHAMIVENAKIKKIWQYWDIDHSKKFDLSFKDACEILKEKFLEATRIRLISDVPLGAFLSGGLDSSITVAAIKKLGVNQIKTFSIGFEEENYNELPYARIIAKHLGIESHETIIRPEMYKILPLLIRNFGEPMADSSAIPTFYVSQFAKSEVTVALTGDGGDELFAGYKRFYKAYLFDKIQNMKFSYFWNFFRKITRCFEHKKSKTIRERTILELTEEELLKMNATDRYKNLVAYFSDKKKNILFKPEFFNLAKNSQTSKFIEYNIEKAKEAKGINKYLYLDMVTYLPEDILFKVDICSMLNSLECRSPFLDHKLIEFVMSLPGEYKLKFPKGFKFILKETFKEWLPKNFIDRRKMGFSIPLALWIRNDLRDIIEERLIKENMLNKLIYQEKLKNIINEHLTGRVSHSKIIWSLLVFSEWMIQYNIKL